MAIQPEENTDEIEDEETKEKKCSLKKSNDMEKELRDKMIKSFINDIQKIASLIFALKDERASEEIQNIDPKLLKLFNPIADAYEDIEDYCSNELNKLKDTESNSSDNLEWNVSLISNI